MDYYISVHWLESLYRYTFSKRFLLPLFLKRTEKKKYQSRRVSFRLRLLSLSSLSPDISVRISFDDKRDTD